MGETDIHACLCIIAILLFGRLIVCLLLVELVTCTYMYDPLRRFVAFSHYRIPRENLLNKSGDVTPDGKYVTPYKVRETTI